MPSSHAVKAAAPASRPRVAAGKSILDSPVIGPWLSVGVTLLVYTHCFGNAFVYDDHQMIDLNPLIGRWDFLWRSFGHDLWWFRPNGQFPKSNYYRPLQDVWLGIHYHLFGFNPVGWHVSIVLMHLVAVYALYHVARSLTKSRVAACVGATLWGVLPIGVQAAAWPVAIPFPMVAAFFLGSMWFFMERRRAPLKFLAISLGLFAGGLLSHEQAVMLPAVLAAYVFVVEDAPAQSDASIRPRPPALSELIARAIDTLYKIAPYLVMVVAYLGLRLAILGFINNKAPGNHATFIDVLLSIPSAFSHYLIMLTVPWVAGPAHAFTFAHSARSPIFYLPAISLIVLAVAAVAIFYRHAHRRLYVFLVIWMLLEIAPVMNLAGLVPAMLIQDRYLYMGAIGWGIILGDIASVYASRGGETRNLAIAVAATVLAVYAVATWHVEGYYHDELTLFTKCVHEDPASTLCHGRLGMLLENRHDLPGAEHEFETALKFNPDDGAALYNLGRLDAAEGRFAEADRRMTKAVKILGNEVPPAFQLQVAEIDDRAGDRANAEAVLKIAETDPKAVPSAEYLRARFMAERHEYAGAEKVLRSLLGREPNSVQVHVALAGVMDSQGKHPDAIAEYRRAVALAPSNAQLHALLASSLYASGDSREALAETNTALRLQPRNALARSLAAQLAPIGAGTNSLSR